MSRISELRHVLKNLAPFFIGPLRELESIDQYVLKCIETLQTVFALKYTECFYSDGGRLSVLHDERSGSIFRRPLRRERPLKPSGIFRGCGNSWVIRS